MPNQSARMLDTQGRLSFTLEIVGRIYLVLTHQSRSGQQRHYRALIVNEGRIQDVTSAVCISIGIEWDNIRGTYIAKGAYRSSDAKDLSDTLQACLRMPEKVPVLML